MCRYGRSAQYGRSVEEEAAEMDSFPPTQNDFSLIDFSLNDFSQNDSSLNNFSLIDFSLNDFLHKDFSLNDLLHGNFSWWWGVGPVDAREGEEKKPLSAVLLMLL